MEVISRKQEQSLETMASMIAHRAPSLAELNPEQLEAIAKLVIMDNLKNELSCEIEKAKVNWNAEKELFLEEHGRKSYQTARAYKNALTRFEKFCGGVGDICCTPKKADDFIYSMKKDNLSPASIRQSIAAVSAFFSFLSRRYEFVKNPLKGTRATPKKEARRASAYPSQSEVKTLLDYVTNKTLKAAFSVMAFRGLRVGALENLQLLDNGQFITQSKGKEVRGNLPKECLEYMDAAGLLGYSHPFGHYKANYLQAAVRYYTKQLYAAGKIAAVYSAHDFRHFFAITEYKKTKDIYQLSKLLNHASIAITEIYLKGLKVEL